MLIDGQGLMLRDAERELNDAAFAEMRGRSSTLWRTELWRGSWRQNAVHLPFPPAVEEGWRSKA
ncbi:hypothetical protein [Amycolatopsis tolypomycina]|uniref:hypothetical protein n=1 Tax=Amycolatopsis tolypomycina TaxID=208445 RepID=UPI0033AA2EFE